MRLVKYKRAGVCNNDLRIFGGANIQTRSAVVHVLVINIQCPCCDREERTLDRVGGIRAGSKGEHTQWFTACLLCVPCCY